MTYVEARNALISRYLTEYQGEFPIGTDNVKIATPNPPVKWVDVNVQFNDGNQSSLGRAGNRKFLRLGLLFIQIRTPQNTATDENDLLAQASVNLFDGERLGQLWLFNGRVKTVGSDGQFYLQNAIVEFKFEDIR
jgi:hypothetical protein